MKRLLTAFCLLSFASPFALAQSLTADELKSGVEYLEKTRAAVVAATRGLTPEQWNFKPAPERWSVAEVTEHIAAAEDMLMGLVRDTVMKSPARKEPADVKAIDDFVRQVIPDRTNKAKSPEPLIPTNRFRTATESLQHFQESRAKTVSFLKETKDAREHAMESPLGKVLDAYQWVLFVAAHSERHTKQILEVKADPRFPKQ
jgi:hypothetical protein